MSWHGDGHLPRKSERWVESPAFTDDDVKWALALDHVDRDRCGGCGQPLSESTAPDADDAFYGHAVRCHGCKAAAHASERVDDKHGLMVWVERDDGGDR